MTSLDKCFADIKEWLAQSAPKDVVAHCSSTFYYRVRDTFIKHKKRRCVKLRIIKHRKMFRKRRRK